MSEAQLTTIDAIKQFLEGTQGLTKTTITGICGAINIYINQSFRNL